MDVLNHEFIAIKVQHLNVLNGDVLLIVQDFMLYVRYEVKLPVEVERALLY